MLSAIRKHPVITGIVVLAGLLILVPAQERTESQVAVDEVQNREDAEDRENRRKGFHCLSLWDGSHRGIVDDLKLRLKDPGSFEHIETRIMPVKDGVHYMSMTYRARNSFGGMAPGSVTGKVNQSTCEGEILNYYNE